MTTETAPEAPTTPETPTARNPAAAARIAAGRKPGRKKGSSNKSPSAAAVKAILRMPLGALTRFASDLTEADLETAKFLCEKIAVHLKSATMNPVSPAVRSD